MFLLKVGSVSLANGDHTSVLGETRRYMTSKLYRATREVQKNTILNRATIELLGADLPTALTELIGRNWKSAVESAFRITWYMCNSMLIPLLFIPFLNKLAKSKFDLPKNFSKTFYNQFEDLLPEKNTEEGNKEFVKKLTALEGKETGHVAVRSVRSCHRNQNQSGCGGYGFR